LMIPVKLPKEVLNLFPTWEYRCPCCGTYIESDKSFCPNCKTPFDEKKWRVPPRFLKSHEAMSEYAHKVLAHRLTQKQRERLFQYFTEIFSDGFESGDFSEWTGTAGSPSVQDSVKHSGTYAMTATGTADKYAYKTFTGQTTLHVRVYVRYSSLSSWASNNQFTRPIRIEGDDTFIATVGVASDRIGMYTSQPSGAWTTAAYTFNVDTWYCIEFRFVKHASAGEYRVYVDGSEEISRTGVNTSGANDADEALVGITQYGSWSTTGYFDCVVVADTYIGPETTAQPYTKTWTTDTLFKKLGIAKTLSVDTAFRKQNIPKTFGLDSAFQKSFATQKQIDTLFKKLDILESFGVDIDFLKRNVVKSFAVDARFGALMTQTIARQIDVLLKKLDETKNFGLDIYFGPVEAEAYTKNFALDVMFAYKVRLPELWLDENGKLVLNISKPYTWVGT